MSKLLKYLIPPLAAIISVGVDNYYPEIDRYQAMVVDWAVANEDAISKMHHLPQDKINWICAEGIDDDQRSIYVFVDKDRNRVRSVSVSVRQPFEDRISIEGRKITRQQSIDATFVGVYHEAFKNALEFLISTETAAFRAAAASNETYEQAFIKYAKLFEEGKITPVQSVLAQDFMMTESERKKFNPNHMWDGTKHQSMY
jgi:hypothetical protein